MDITTHGFDQDPLGTSEAAARIILAGLTPPAGRAGFTVPQKLELAQVYATLALVEQAKVQNALALLQLGVPSGSEHDETVSADPKTTRRVSTRNRLRQVIREGLGL